MNDIGFIKKLFMAKPEIEGFYTKTDPGFSMMFGLISLVAAIYIVRKGR